MIKGKKFDVKTWKHARAFSPLHLCGLVLMPVNAHVSPAGNTRVGVNLRVSTTVHAYTCTGSLHVYMKVSLKCEHKLLLGLYPQHNCNSTDTISLSFL